MLTKEQLHQLVERMPEKFTLDEIISEIILANKIEIARKQVKNCEFFTEEDLNKEFGF